MRNIKKTFLILIVLGFFTAETSAQQISDEDFWSTVMAEQDKIDLLRQGMSDAVNDYFDLKNLEAIAYQTHDPQAYLDYSLARYHRMVSFMNDTAARKAEGIANYMIKCKGKVKISTLAMQEGIAKYTDMRDFFLKYARKHYSLYQELWNKYSAKYGNNGKENLVFDDAYMKQYGTVVKN